MDGKGGSPPVDAGPIPDHAPPAYDLLYETPQLQGVPPPSYNQAEAVPPYTPGLLYADFLPRCLQPGTKDRHPQFDTFQSVMQGVNYWLQCNPMYVVNRCETLERRWANKDGVLETESTIYHEPIFGEIGYVRGVRLWLLPNPQPGSAPQQIRHINIVPEEELLTVVNTGMGFQQFVTDPSDSQSQAVMTQMMMMQAMGRGRRGMGGVYVFPAFKTLDETLQKFNENLTANPIPGKVLSIETFDIKYRERFEPKCVDPDKSSWVETGSASKLYLTVIRIYYLEGPAEPITSIGLQDFVPETTEVPKSHQFQLPKFENFSSVLQKAGYWFSSMQNVRVTNIQTYNTKISHALGHTSIKSRSTYYVGGSVDSTFLQVIRVGFVTPATPPPPGPPRVLNCRTFVPLRIAAREAETTSQTVQRINAWLNASGARVVSAETVQYEYRPDNRRITDTERPANTVIRGRQHFWISAIRIYIDGMYNEPPPEAMPPVPQYEYKRTYVDSSSGSSGTCVIT